MTRVINKTVEIHVADANGVAERWRNQYARPDQPGGWYNWGTHTGGDIYEKLCALGDNPPVDKVAEIIGNKSWSHIHCAQCHDYVLMAAKIDNWGDGNIYVCTSCLDAALTAIRTAAPDTPK